MARLRRASPTAHEHADNSEFVRSRAEPYLHRTATNNAGVPESSGKASRRSPRKKALKSPCDPEESDQEVLEAGNQLVLKTGSAGPHRSKQIRLAPLKSMSIARPPQVDLLPIDDLNKLQLRSKVVPTRKPGVSLQQRSSYNDAPSEVGESSNGPISVDAEESIWCGSDDVSEDSEEELPSPRKILASARRRRDENVGNSTTCLPKSQSIGVTVPELVLKRLPVVPANRQQPSSRPGSSSDKENNHAFLHFSPPRLYSPAKISPQRRDVTPPQSPSKSRLQSPSKPRTRILTPPLRQSLDAFWDADTVNDWNEQYSPKKVLKSPKKLKFLQDDQLGSPSSPRKCQSPGKRTKAELDAKKDFAARKHRLAEAFLAELDKVVTNEKIKELSASTGGVKLIWSKTLNSTAGRANWRRETTKSSKLDGTFSTTHKHHASIELAEKVIDDEDRLLNVIAHEFCHLANFMVSGIKDQPHGRQFKEWGRKCTHIFGHRGVKVTTKHTYEIEYKHVWQCSNEECAVEFKRHSKSIDPKRHTCGTCRSKLVQIKPVPRKDAGNGTGYAAYVKAHFANVKRDMPSGTHKEVMEAVARKYRADKEVSKSAADEIAGRAPVSDTKATSDIDRVARVLEFVTLDDD